MLINSVVLVFVVIVVAILSYAAGSAMTTMYWQDKVIKGQLLLQDTLRKRKEKDANKDDD